MAEANEKDAQTMIRSKIKRWFLRYESTNFVWYPDGGTVQYFENKMAAKVVRNRHNATAKRKVYVSPGPDHARYPTFKDDTTKSPVWTT